MRDHDTDYEAFVAKKRVAVPPAGFPVDAADAKLAQLAGVGPREMALLVRAAREHVPASVKDTLVADATGAKREGYHQLRPEHLAGIPSLAQLKLALAVLVAHEIREIKEYEREDGTVAWWVEESAAAS
jgi:hypothetical protein